MKKLLKIMIITMLVSPVSVYAQGGFVADKPNTVSPTSKGDYTKLTTIAEAKKQPDDTFVMLEGYITGSAKSLNAEEYMFKDDSGTIKIEINKNVWRNQTVTPSTKIRILGQVDHNPFVGSTEIEVRQLDIIK